MLTHLSNPTSARVAPMSLNGRTLLKLVYVVLEPQYQSAVAAGAELINRSNPVLAVDVKGYLIEELRDPERYAEFRNDVANADIFFASMIFIEDLANKIVDAVKPHVATLKASVIFPCMPQVMRLSKVGSFSMGSMGQSKSALSSFMKKRKAQNKGGSFQEGMLKMVQTLPKILKYLPMEKAQDARNFMLSYQYWLGGSSDNMANLLLMLAHHYFPNQRKLNFMPPIEYPDLGIWHPLAPKMFEDVREFQAWYNNRSDLAELTRDPMAPTIGLILQRTHLVTGDDGHYVAMVQELESRGARVIPIFAAGLDCSKPVEKFFYSPINNQPLVDTVVSLTGFSLVGGPAKNDPEAAIAAMKKLNRPYMVCLPLVFQTTEEWESSDLGLHPVQVALQVALPELDGAIEPIILSGRDAATGKAIPMADRIELVAARALKWANLRKKPRLDKKVAITVFSFPPDKGNVGTAAYLDVFASIHNVLRALKENGYDVDGLPTDGHSLLLEVLHDVTAQIRSSEINVAAKMTVQEYEALTPFSDHLVANWGEAPGPFNTDGTNLVVYGKHYGNIFIGVQPSFGYEGDPMRLMFSKSCSPHHGFAAYYTYIEKIWGADAVLHFGTHGALEFMPGKQMGMSGNCYPDRLIGSLPNLYYYSVNNPSEATIAKRRSYASIISYLTPPAENAGLYKGLKELQELVASYKQLRESDRGTMVCETIVEKVRQVNLDNDVPIPEVLGSIEDRDNFIGLVYKFLMEIEDRLVPCDLHVVGTAPTAVEAIDTLVGVASFDRPEMDMEGLDRMLARSKGWDIETLQKAADTGSIESLDHIRTIKVAAKAAVRALVDAQTDVNGRVSRVSLLNFFKMGTTEPWVDALKAQGFVLDPKDIKPTFTYLEDVLERIVSDNELGALVKALEGDFTIPGPGGDTVRNPLVLPTGRNIHALDPQSIPTAAAVKSAQIVVDRMLARHKAENNGQWPETIATVLWGTDNIKTYGEALAQIMAMIGVKPTPDSIGRMNCITVIPLEELGRPRIDVVVTCSGIFRDLFPNQMELVDMAVKTVADLDEPLDQNYIRKHALDQAKELGITPRQAATRVFSNASGSYAANVNFAIENSAWETEDQLHEMYLSRKSFAFGTDANNQQQRGIYEAALKTVDTAFQNLDSNETSITDVDHYFDYLGAVTGVVEKMRGGKRPSVYMADTTSAQAKIRSIEEMVRLDSRTKLLNPKWYEGMLKHGFEGVRELQSRLVHTFGWSATAHAVDGWVYDETANTFMNDEEMADRLKQLNPHAYRKMVGVLLEANGRGYWETTKEQMARLQDLYQDLEDDIEGVNLPPLQKTPLL